ncbi:hypothetical protein PanWU01x14_293910 [Parasponia andersonii]|uniref:Uncharacterized protein n=1 Tax=Parasponia andersonii TaxID=3476 RepID=A0A2P5AWH0_PARAD|nr:hypothetical protein PanWU01x14_293910 [Parasponia andersonii]
MSLISTPMRVSNLTSRKPDPEPVSPPTVSNPSEQLASPTVSLSGKMTKVSPPPIDDGLRFIMEKKKNMEKLASERVLICHNLTTWCRAPCRSLSWGRTLPLLKWASPKSFRLLRVKVPKLNSVVTLSMAEQSIQQKKKKKAIYLSYSIF